jgi:hypothetical protein
MAALLKPMHWFAPLLQHAQGLSLKRTCTGNKAKRLVDFRWKFPAASATMN